jgi:hypothetical protein
MSETFAQYLEKWLKHSTAQGLNNPLVEMPIKHFRLLQPNAIVLLITMLLTSAWLTSCAIPLTRHDSTTYKNLTDLKAEAMVLVETFDAKPFAANEAAIADITLKFRNPAPWHPPAPAGGGKRFLATVKNEASRVSSSGRSRC